MPKIEGSHNKDGRLIIINESNWAMEVNKNLTAVAETDYSETVTAGTKLVAFRKTDGETKVYGNVNPKDTSENGLGDSSSNNHVFTAVGATGATFNENFKFGASTLKFTENDQKLTSPASNNWNLGTIFTISAWVRFDPKQAMQLSNNGGAKIVSNYQAVSGEGTMYDGYELGLNSGGYLIGYYYRGASQYQTGASSTLITNGGWHHVALQRGVVGEGNILRIYIDGVVENSSSSLGDVTHNNVTVNSFTIGARAASSMSLPFLNGTIDELEIINGINKFNMAGFTSPTSESTSTDNHLLLMHFNDSAPEATLWYDMSNLAGQRWMGNGMQYSMATEAWSRLWLPAYIEVCNQWYTRFRPEKIRITGVADGSDTFYLEDAAHNNIVSGTPITGTVTMATTFISKNTADDFSIFYFNAFSSITCIQCDAEATDPQGA